MENALVRQAVEIATSQSELARLCGKKQGHVAYWLKAERVTAEVAILIDKATKGQVSKEHLRPDIFGPVRKDEAA